MLFVIFEAAIELLVGSDEPLAGQGGGALGFMVSQGLVLVLGVPVTVVVLILAAIGAVLAFIGVTLHEVVESMRHGWRRLRGTTPGPEGTQPNPPLPLGENVVAVTALVARLERTARVRLCQAFPEVPPLFPATDAQQAAKSSRSVVAPIQPTPAQNPPAAAGDRRTSAQIWRLPVLGESR